jgi:hypothetical protein
MNERLKTFYDQVGLDFENFQRVTVTKGDMEKFAELIVKEVLDEVLQAMDNGMDVYDTVADKFGVEE